MEINIKVFYLIECICIEIFCKVKVFEDQELNVQFNSFEKNDFCFVVIEL